MQQPPAAGVDTPGRAPVPPRGGPTGGPPRARARPRAPRPRRRSGAGRDGAGAQELALRRRSVRPRRVAHARRPQPRARRAAPPRRVRRQAGDGHLAARGAARARRRVRAHRARTDSAREPTFAGEIEDDQLRLILVCCHPDVPADARIALTLKVVCGFSVREIARAFLAGEAAIAQRIARAKRLIRDRALPFEVPAPREVAGRRDSVLKVLYLLFNEGYSPGEGEQVIRADICAEAVRLAEAVAAHPVVSHPRVSRARGAPPAAGRAARVAPGQGRRHPAARAPGSKRPGTASGSRAASATSSARWAAIASPPTTSRRASPPVTPRRRRGRRPTGATIVEYYDRLVALDGSPVTALNRAVALAMVDGPEAGLAAIEGIADGRRSARLPSARLGAR